MYNDNHTTNKSFNKYRELINDIKTGMVVSVDNQNNLRGRPMFTARVDGEGSLWFISMDDTKKLQEMSSQRYVNVCYSNISKHQYVSVNGLIYIFYDKNLIRDLWNNEIATWFPDEVNLSQLAVLKVNPVDAEYWDADLSLVKRIFEEGRFLLEGEKNIQTEHNKVIL